MRLFLTLPADLADLDHETIRKARIVTEVVKQATDLATPERRMRCYIERADLEDVAVSDSHMLLRAVGCLDGIALRIDEWNPETPDLKTEHVLIVELSNNVEDCVMDGDDGFGLLDLTEAIAAAMKKYPSLDECVAMLRAKCAPVDLAEFDELIEDAGEQFEKKQKAECLQAAILLASEHAGENSAMHYACKLVNYRP